MNALLILVCVRELPCIKTDLFEPFFTFPTCPQFFLLCKLKTKAMLTFKDYIVQCKSRFVGSYFGEVLLQLLCKLKRKAMLHVFIRGFQHKKQVKSSQLHSWPKIAPTSSITSQKQIIHWKSASMRSHMHWTWSKWIKSKHSNAAAVISPMQELHSVK